MLKSPTKILYQSGTLYPDDIQLLKVLIVENIKRHQSNLKNKS